MSGQRAQQAAKTAGHGTVYKQLQRPLSIGGVGKHDEKVTDEVHVPLAFEGGFRSVFQAPVVKQSGLPALLGLEVLEHHGALIDTKHHRLYLPGPGGFKLHLSPGSHCLKLRKAVSGHLMLPCTAWENQKANAQHILTQP